MSKRCEAGGHTRSMGVVMRRINASVCLVALVLVGCGVGTHAPNSGAGQAAAATAPTTTPKPGEVVKSAASAGLAWPVSLGLGHDPISALATDPSRAGVWFMCGDQTGAKACFWDARRHTLSSWTLEPAPVTHMDASAGMVVDSHGDLWVGANETLARLDPASGAVTSWSIPLPPESPFAEEPSDHQVMALTIGAGGVIVIGMTSAADLEAFNPATQAFSTIPLPQIGWIQGLASLRDGTVAVAMVNQTEHPFQADALILISPSGSEESLDTGSEYVTSNGDLFLAGATTWATIDAAGGITPVSVAPTSGRDQRINPDEGAILGDGRIVLGTGGGIAVVNGPSTLYLDLPTWTCTGNLISFPVPPPSLPANGVQCGQTPMVLAVDGAGNVWIVPNLPQSEVGLIPAGAY